MLVAGWRAATRICARGKDFRHHCGEVEMLTQLSARLRTKPGHSRWGFARSWIVFATGIVFVYLTLMTAHMGGPAR